MKPSRSKTPSRTGVGTRTPLAPMRTPISARTGRTPARRQVSKETDTVKDPVEVFCRVRPGDGDSECLQVLNENTVQLVPPATSRAYNIGKETQCSFKYVFDEDSAQAHVFDRVGLPLVTDLVQGKNGLLFTYGVTGSGKTHTMQGTSKDGGVMTRAIDVIFNSLSELQTRKFQLKPDKLNGFEIMLDADAALERQQELVNNIKTPGRRRGVGGNISGEADLSNRIVDTQKVLVDEDMQFAVFVSYVEIYNNYTYDLLDQPKMDIVTGRQKLASKILREDSYRNMYVHGVTEVEVKSPEEALDAFYRGQKQRSVSATLLNMQSSRSHSIFNIRVVSVPLDPLGEDILCDSSALIVGQLALVDLAGSERTNRTGNTGQRLAEASKINQSLMTLRNCIEVLRDNQSSGGTKAVPYRDSRVTHLFRNYFEGEGKVKMVVCVNPRPTDYDENVNVMKFAELTQEVQIERAVGVRFDLGLTPGRRRANQVYKEAVRRLAEQGEEVEHLVMDLAPVYSLGPAWPPLELTQFDSEDIIERLRVYLEKRIGTRKTLLEDVENRHSKFRVLLSKQEKEVVLLRAENKQMKVQLEGERKRVATMRVEKPIKVVDRTEKEEKEINTPVERKHPEKCEVCHDSEKKKCKECGCRKCGGKDEADNQVMCDECDGAYHFLCLKLKALPEDDEWFCPECKNDDDIVKAGEKVKVGKKKAKMISNTGTTKRDWGNGFATVGRKKECKVVDKDHFGPVPGIEVGMNWFFRVQISEEGIHRPHVAGIAGSAKTGCPSLVLSGGYEDDIDNGEEFTYTGSGGRDLSGNKRTAEQSSDQELTRSNGALAINCACKFDDAAGGEATDWKKGKPIRVVRGYKGAKHSKFAPEAGNRYDGIYKVVKYWPEKGKSGFRVWRYLLRRDDSASAPWTKEGKKRMEEGGYGEVTYPEGYHEAQAEKEKEKAAKEAEKKKDKEEGKDVGKENKGKGKKRKADEDMVDNGESKPKKVKTKQEAKEEVIKKVEQIPKSKYKLSADLLKAMEADELNCKVWDEVKEKGYTNKKEMIEFVESQFGCMICQDIVYEPITTPCLHNICNPCLARSFKAEVFSCPSCRGDLGKDYEKPINSQLQTVLNIVFPGYEAGR